MQADGYGEHLIEDEEIETIRNLRLDDSIRKVKVTLDERMLHIEQQYGATIDIHLSHIVRTQHHSTHLVPLWTFVPAFVCLWAGLRIVTDVLLQFTLIACSASIFTGRFLTGKPTLTIQTKDLDGYSLYGNDAELLRLAYLVRRLKDGQTLKQARLGLSQLQRGGPEYEVPLPEPTFVMPSTSLNAFLNDDSELDVQEEEGSQYSDWTPLDANDPLPSITLPDDHRPQPVSSPVLVPATWTIPTHPQSVHVPMYQEEPSHSSALQTPHGFFPSYITGNQVHIPQQFEQEAPREGEESVEDEDEIFEAELLDIAENDNPQTQVEPPLEQPVLRPRQRTNDTTPILRKKMRNHPQGRRGPRAFFNTLRQHLPRPSRSLSSRAATHNATRFEAPRSTAHLHQRTQSHTRDAMEQLSHELPEETLHSINERIRKRAEMMQKIKDKSEDDLEQISFGQLQATSPSEHVKIRRIEDAKD